MSGFFLATRPPDRPPDRRRRVTGPTCRPVAMETRAHLSTSRDGVLMLCACVSFQQRMLGLGGGKGKLRGNNMKPRMLEDSLKKKARKELRRNPKPSTSPPPPHREREGASALCQSFSSIKKQIGRVCKRVKTNIVQESPL